LLRKATISLTTLFWLTAANVVLLPVLLPFCQAIVLQGIVGCFPWQAMVFFTLWLQLNGFSNATSSMLVATFGAGVAMVRMHSMTRCTRTVGTVSHTVLHCSML
jgi:hypothetical protein